MLTIYIVYHLVLVDCKWAEWGAAEACSKTCGVGVLVRRRSKLVVENNGGKCIGEFSNTETCNIASCSGIFCFLTNVSPFMIYLPILLLNKNALP